jgi:hypothetical protein
MRRQGEARHGAGISAAVKAISRGRWRTAPPASANNWRAWATRGAIDPTIHHKVADYAKWRAGYDAHEKSRLSAGITNGRVFRSAEDPNDVVVLLDVADVAKARVWLGSDDLKAAMQKSGVVGSARIRFAT